MCRYSKESGVAECVCDRVAPNGRLTDISLTCKLPWTSVHPKRVMRATNNDQLKLVLTAAVQRSDLSLWRSR